MAIREGKWDCNVCGTTAVRGPLTQCPNCASPRPENVKFYLSDDAMVVSDEKKLSEANAGADWICTYCSGHNKAWQTQCSSCGNAKSVANGDKVIEEKTEYFDQRKNTAKSAIPETPKKSSGIGKKLLKIFGFIALGVIAFSILASFDKEIEVQILAHGWERTVQMEENKLVTEEDWQLPQGASLIKSYRAIHHYNEVLIGHEQRTRTVQVKTGSRRVVCGQKDMGNGYFQDVYCNEPIYESREESYQEPIYRKDPIYQTKYQYTIYRWKKTDPLVARGTKKNAEWPQPASNQSGENFRQGERKQRYWLEIKTPDGEEKIEDVTQEKWNKYPEKGKAKATKSLIFGFYKKLKE